MSESPTPHRRRPKLRRWAVPVLALACAGAAAAVYAVYDFRSTGSASMADAEGRARRVETMNLDVTVKKQGELEAVKNTEIVNEVPGSRTVTYLIPEGARVKQGETLAVLSGDDLEDEIEVLSQDLITADANLMNAREALETQLRQSADEVEGAQVLLSLADLDLKRYEQGEYPQQLDTARTKLEMAEIKLANTQEDLQNTLALFSKGFVTAQRVKEQRLAVKQAENVLDEARTDLKVLTDYQYPMDLQGKQDKLRQAKNRVDRVKANSKSAEFNRQQTVLRSQERVAQLQERLEEKRGDLARCTIAAPEPGLVVYHNDGRTEVAEGMQVRHRQTLMLLPDTEHMKAVVRVPENRVGEIRNGMRAVVDKPIDGFSPLMAKVGRISVLASSDGRWFNSESREYPVDLVLDNTPEGLKPGLKIEATVFVERLRNVLAVPLQCVYTRAEQAFVFVCSDAPQSLEARAVKLGKANETFAQVIGGLRPGERVLELQVGEGRELLERLGLHLIEAPTTGPSDAVAYDDDPTTPAAQPTASGDASPALGQ